MLHVKFILLSVLWLVYYFIIKNLRTYKPIPNEAFLKKGIFSKKALSVISVILGPILLIGFSNKVYFIFSGEYIVYHNAGADQSYYEHQTLGIITGLLFYLSTLIFFLKIYRFIFGERGVGLLVFLIVILSIVNFFYLILEQSKPYNY